ncbi:Sporulation factor SpoIIGA [Eubacteriaceae bacterium CHKCI005]|nr:Sporulation factor SpoIIGA [Eubacteriaceae bacterium CHKCI005]
MVVPNGTGDDIMKQTVYVDILFAVNLFINYFLLCLTAKVTRIHTKRWRMLAGSALGAVYSLFIFFPEIPSLLSAAAKLIFSITILLAALPIHSIKVFLKTLACFFGANFLFAGLMMALWLFVSPNNLMINNGIVYFNISPLILIGGAAVSYLILSMIHRFTLRKAPDNKIYTVTIEVDGQTATMDALLDTGHSLTESISDLPVLLAEYKSVEKLIPSQVRPVFEPSQRVFPVPPEDSSWRRRFRVVPFHSVGGGGVLPAFRPDSITVTDGQHPVRVPKSFVAVSGTHLSDGEYEALMNPDMIENTIK